MMSILFVFYVLTLSAECGILIIAREVIRMAENKSIPFWFRVTAEEKEQIKQLAAASGMSMSAYARWCMLYKDKEGKK